MYALFLLIATAAFGLWYGLSRLFNHLEEKHNDRKEDHHGNQESEHQDEHR